MPAKPAPSQAFSIRLPLDLYEELVAYADRESISLNGAVVRVVQAGLIAEREVDAQVAALMPTLGPRLAAAIRAQNAAARAKRKTASST